MASGLRYLSAALAADVLGRCATSSAPRESRNPGALQARWRPRVSSLTPKSTGAPSFVRSARPLLT